MTMFPGAVAPLPDSDSDPTREDILLLCRLYREERVARLHCDDLRAFRQRA